MAKKLKNLVGNMIGFHGKEDEEKKSQTVLGGYDIKVEDSSEANKPKSDPDEAKKDDKSEEKPDDEPKNSSDTGVTDKKSQKSGKAPANEEANVNEVFVGTSKIQAQPKEPLVDLSMNIVDALARYEKDNLPLAAAQLFATNGKTLDRNLEKLIQMAIESNQGIRAYVSRHIPAIMEEYPEQLSAYSAAVNKIASDIRIKHLFYCPIDRNLYDSEDLAFEHLGKSDIIALTRGAWSFQDAWVKTDSDGKIIEQDGTMTESEVRNLIAGLPKAIQQETADKLHIKWGKKQDNKPDDQDSDSGKDADDDNAKDGNSNRKNSGRGGKKSPKQQS